MGNRFLVLFLFLLLCGTAQAAPDTTMSITPTANSGEIITASDENSRNSSISTPYNAHSHLDISDMSSVNIFRIGDGAAGNKTYSVNDDQGSDPALRYNTTTDFWQLSADGSTFDAMGISSGNVIVGENNFRVGDNTDVADKDITFNEASTDGKLRWDISEDLFKVSHDGGSTFLYNVHSADSATIASGSVLIAAGNGAIQYAGILGDSQALVGNSSGPPTPQTIATANEGVRVYNSANQSISNDTETAITFDSENFDDNGLHSTSSNTSRLTAQIAGNYIITGNASFASNSTGLRYMTIRLNGSTELAKVNDDASSGNRHEFVISTIYNLAASDYVELMCYQNSTISLNILTDSANQPSFSMHKVD